MSFLVKAQDPRSFVLNIHETNLESDSDGDAERIMMRLRERGLGLRITNQIEEHIEWVARPSSA